MIKQNISCYSDVPINRTNDVNNLHRKPTLQEVLTYEIGQLIFFLSPPLQLEELERKVKSCQSKEEVESLTFTKKNLITKVGRIQLWSFPMFLYYIYELYSSFPCPRNCMYTFVSFIFKYLNNHGKHYCTTKIFRYMPSQFVVEVSYSNFSQKAFQSQMFLRATFMVCIL